MGTVDGKAASLFNSPEYHRSESLFNLRYLAAGMDSVRSAVTRLRSSADANGRELADTLAKLADAQGGIQFLLADGLRIQRAILDVLRAPAATAATELAERGLSATRRHLWREALADFDASLAHNWDQPDVLFHRGIAVLALGVEENGQATTESIGAAAESFRQSMDYGVRTMPGVAVASTLMAATHFDRIGDREAADAVMRKGSGELTQSPEVLFSAALRFADGQLLDRAVALDPTLALDQAWPGLPFARAVEQGLRERQNSAIATASDWLAAAAALTGGRPSSGRPAQTVVDGHRTVRDLIGTTERVRAELRQQTTQEARYHNEAAVMDEQARAAYAAAEAVLRRSSWRVGPALAGGAIIVVTIPVSLILLYVLVGPEPPVADPNPLEPIIMAGCVFMVLVGLAVIAAPVLRGPNRPRQAAALTAGNPDLHRRAEQARAAAGAIERDRAAVSDRLPAVLAGLRSVSERATDAYAKTWRPAPAVADR